MLTVLAVLVHAILGAWLSGGGAMLCLGDEPHDREGEAHVACSHEHSHGEWPLPVPVQEHEDDCGCFDVPLGQVRARSEGWGSGRDALRWVLAHDLLAPLGAPRSPAVPRGRRVAGTAPASCAESAILRTTRLLL